MNRRLAPQQTCVDQIYGKSGYESGYYLDMHVIIFTILFFPNIWNYRYPAEVIQALISNYVYSHVNVY
jgi:hypothetical protein